MVRGLLKAVLSSLLIGLGSLMPGAPSAAQEVSPLPWDRTLTRLPVRIETDRDRASLVFDWPLPVAAAVFQHGKTLWIVFDEPAEISRGSLRVALAGWLLPLSARADGKATVLRFEILGGANVKVGRKADAWRVTLSRNAVPPDHAISLSQTEISQKGVRAFVPLVGPGLYLKIRDPASGDLLHIVPLLAASWGVARGAEIGKFEVLQTAQGLAVAKIADDVELARYANGVAIGSRILLAASAPPLPAGARLVSVMDRDTSPARMIDLERWRLGGLEKFNANQRMLNRRLASSGSGERNERRWDLARFYLAHAMYVEASAYLDIIKRSDPVWSNEPRFKAVRALAEAGLGNPGRALKLISAPELDAEPEISLWRSQILAAGGSYRNALITYERGRGALALFGPQEIVEFNLAAFSAAIETGQMQAADREAGQLRRLRLNRHQTATMDYLEGRLKEVRGALPEAMALYAAVAESSVRPASGMARLALIELQLERRQIKLAAAIEALESLRFSWRGDPFELRLARVLGRLYLDQGNRRDGLMALRRAVVQFPSHPLAQALTQKMSEVFRELFEDGEFDDLQALSTLALYSEFKELTPLGAQGDRMIRQLAEGLVALDLLDQAADLLAHQVRFRSSGADRASIAARLAEIYVLDRSPEAALEILDETAEVGLPVDTVRRRGRARSQALTALGRYAEAESGIRSDRGHLAEAIRAQIYWRDQRWRDLIRSANTLLDAKADSGKQLGSDERRILIRHAVALAIIGDKVALARLRHDYAGRMQAGFVSAAFDLITQPQEFAGQGLRELVSGTASVKLMRHFMNRYRQDFGVTAVIPGQ